MKSSIATCILLLFLICPHRGNALPPYLPSSSPPPAADNAPSDNGQQDELLFVQTIWRHGDRTPINTFPNDPNQEQVWAQGFGELTTRGMAQHVQLGNFLRKRYIDELALLAPQYSSRNVFVISTYFGDTNRTIQSATANLIGMYSKGARWGVDYPDLPEWPTAYVPIPVHTYEFKKDPVGYARTFCQRTIELFDLISRTGEYQQLNESSAAVLAKVSEYAGTKVTLSNLWTFIEAVNIERTHGLKPPEWAVQILPQLVDFNTRLIDFNSGIGLAPFLGVDFATEVPKMLGGSFLWELVNRMHKKIECVERAKNQSPKQPSLRDTQRTECGWLAPLKYYAHSAHDMTLAALFSTFQFQHVDFDRNGFPGYASCALVELWRQAGQGDYYVKLWYRRDNEDQLIDLTPHIRGCEQGCTLERFAQRSQPYQAQPDQETLCRTPLIYRPVRQSEQTSASPADRQRSPWTGILPALLVLSASEMLALRQHLFCVFRLL